MPEPDVSDVAGARRIGLGVIALGAAVFVVVAATQVPWGAGHGQPVDASSVFTPAEIDRAEHFSRWARLWSWSSLAVSLAVAVWLGVSKTARQRVQELPGPWWLRVTLTVTGLTLIGTVATLPFGIALRQLRLDAGLAAGSWSAWAIDVVKGDLVTVVATSIAVVVLCVLTRRLPRTWPAVAGLVLAGLTVTGSFIYPVVVEPLFNNFDSLPDGSLRTAVFALADKEGVPIDDVLVADASRRTTSLNAYVSGFGGSRRVVLYDTLVDGTPQDETLSVVGHELAHAKYDDVLTGTTLGAAGALVGVGLLGLLLPAGVSDARRVPLLLAMVAVATVATGPLQSGISRQLETRADETALEVTRTPQSFVALQRRLAVRSLADPTPPAWSQWWFGTHPTVLQRIGLTRD